MNVCMVCGEYPPLGGGVGQYVKHLSHQIEKSGLMVTVLTRGISDQTHVEIDYETGVKVIRVRYIPLFPMHVHLHGYFLQKALDEYCSSCDIIHFHSPLIPNVKAKVPCLVTEHGTVRGFIKGLRSNDPFSVGQKVFSSVFCGIDKRIIERSDIVTAVSSGCAQELKDFYRVRKDIICTGNGVDTGFFRPLEGKGNCQDTVLFVGSLISKKGIYDLIDASAIVCKQRPLTRFLLAGKGPLESQIKSRISNLGLRGNFRLLGHLSHNELRTYYQMASVFVLPSYHEGLPTVILEAMSCGLPVVTTRVSGNSEVVEDQVNGLLVEAGKPEELAVALLKVLAEPEWGTKLGQNGRMRAVQSHSWSALSNVYLGLYHELV